MNNESTSPSATALGGLTVQDFASILIRLTVCIKLIVNIESIVGSVTGLLMLARYRSLVPLSDISIMQILTSMWPLILIPICVVLFLFSRPLGRIIGGRIADVPMQIGVDPRSLMIVLFAIVGVYWMVVGLSTLPTTFQVLNVSRVTPLPDVVQEKFYIATIGAALQVLGGLALVLGADGLLGYWRTLFSRPDAAPLGNTASPSSHDAV